MELEEKKSRIIELEEKCGTLEVYVSEFQKTMKNSETSRIY